MRFACTTLALSGALSLMTGTAGAQTPLTLAEVVARAREHAPQVVAARLAVDETRGRLLGAGLRFQTNPEVELGLGNRTGSSTRSTDLDVGVGQLFEPAGRRTARIASARAQIGTRTAVVDEITRAVTREALAAFYSTLHANERIRLLTNTEQLAVRVHEVADRRFRAGDLAVLDVNIARSAVARIRASREAAEAVRITSLGGLKSLLGIEGPIDVEGSLTPAAAPDAAALWQSAMLRPELRSLESELQEAEADTQFGRTFSRPDYTLGAKYQRDGGDQILLGALTVSLPLFSTGQEVRAVGTARATRLRTELTAARARVQIELRTALDVYARRLEALRILQREALPTLEENEALAARSFEVGQIGLPDLLLIRREIQETQFQFLDAQLEAALARVSVDAAAAVLR